MCSDKLNTKDDADTATKFEKYNSSDSGFYLCKNEENLI
jgi:hypothetical protein